VLLTDIHCTFLIRSAFPCQVSQSAARTLGYHSAILTRLHGDHH